MACSLEFIKAKGMGTYACAKKYWLLEREYVNVHYWIQAGAGAGEGVGVVARI